MQINILCNFMRIMKRAADGAVRRWMDVRKVKSEMNSCWFINISNGSANVCTIKCRNVAQSRAKVKATSNLPTSSKARTNDRLCDMIEIFQKHFSYISE